MCGSDLALYAMHGSGADPEGLRCFEDTRAGRQLFADALNQAACQRRGVDVLLIQVEIDPDRL